MKILFALLIISATLPIPNSPPEPCIYLGTEPISGDCEGDPGQHIHKGSAPQPDDPISTEPVLHNPPGNYCTSGSHFPCQELP